MNLVKKNWELLSNQKQNNLDFVAYQVIEQQIVH